ncbi:MAG: hypothetical protein LBN02_00275 [Oscillospiraceae bacterium]|jgi:hypothetical protein|nr:hypothetical protein [Oscillospiraceae bacterium]
MIEENIMIEVLLIIGFFAMTSLPFLPFLPAILRARKLRKLGYKRLVRSMLWAKDGEIFIIFRNKPHNAAPIDIVGVSGIRRNTRLCGLEVRYRENGVLKSTRISGFSDEILQLADELGYGEDE